MAGRWTDCEVKKLAQYVSQHEFIYNAQHKDHLDTKAIVEELHKFGQSLSRKRTGDAIYKKWLDLRGHFMKMRRQLKTAQTRSAEQGKPIKPWKHYDHFKYLNDYVGPCSSPISVSSYQPIRSVDDKENSLSDGTDNSTGDDLANSLGRENNQSNEVDESNWDLPNIDDDFDFSVTSNTSFSGQLSPPEVGNPNRASNRQSSQENSNRTIFRDESNLFHKQSKISPSQQFYKSINTYLGQIVDFKAKQPANRSQPEDQIDVYLKSLKPNLELISESPQILRKVKLGIQKILLEGLNDLSQLELPF